jgi:histidinol-phosphate phosphatase family protein
MSEVVRTVFLDRDGVINRKAPEGDYVERWDQFAFLPGAVEAIRWLRAGGLRIIVATNQRGIAIGRMTRDDVDDIHRRMNEEIFGTDPGGLTVLVCPHEVGSCDCRKPDVGLYRQAEARFPDLDSRSSVVIGDSASDVLFGNRIGCRTFLIGEPERAVEITGVYPGSRIDGVAPALLDLVNERLFGATATPATTGSHQGFPNQ